MAKIAGKSDLKGAIMGSKGYDIQRVLRNLSGLEYL
jgi:hypothetical protein